LKRASPVRFPKH